MTARSLIPAAALAAALTAAVAPAAAYADPVLTSVSTASIGPGSTVMTVSQMHGNTADGLGCTVGFLAQRPDGTRVGVYAGHCGDVGQKVVFQNHIVGTVASSSSPKLTAAETFVDTNAPDWATFTVDPAAASLMPVGRVHPLSVGHAKVGDAVCSDGATSGWRCGTVVDVTGSYIATTIGVSTGDSGGPLIRTSDNAALGIASRAATFGNAPTPTGSLFYDLGSALAAAGGLSLVTG
ncbi:S1 family peptidase [Tsukamurella soli]|uniref:Trypsin n=1 Tax=Tsukamurella soli TaxID=644556 RepID=A0ABP8JG82_9ACTN